MDRTSPLAFCGTPRTPPHHPPLQRYQSYGHPKTNLRSVSRGESLSTEMLVLVLEGEEDVWTGACVGISAGCDVIYTKQQVPLPSLSPQHENTRSWVYCNTSKCNLTNDADPRPSFTRPHRGGVTIE
ncbi:hypothetical protein J6590_057921 [Homalodisca vitripennis]|nr:hypothetical protein J6590_057921 [Homalodisca vitripennis]